MEVPEEHIEAAKRRGITFSISQQDGRGQPYQTLIDSIASPDEAVRQAQQFDAWHIAVFTSEGYHYWSSRHPDLVYDNIERQILTTLRLPHFEMKWTVYFRAIRKEKAEKYLRKLNQSLGVKLQSIQCERYDRVPSLFRIDFTVRFETESIQEAVFQALMLCQKGCGGWQISGPSTLGNELWEFSGYTKHDNIGVTGLYFQLLNYTHHYSNEENLEIQHEQ